MALGPEDSALESGEGAARGWAGVWGPGRGVVVLMAHVARSCLPIAQPAAVTTLGYQGGGPAPCSPTFPMCTLKGLGGRLGLCPREVVSEQLWCAGPSCLQGCCGPRGGGAGLGPPGHLSHTVSACPLRSLHYWAVTNSAPSQGLGEAN